MGDRRMREAFGDGYVEALRLAYPELPPSADYVLYWWYRAGLAVANETAIAAGIITTNSITQGRSREVIRIAREAGARVRWAVTDHPWVSEAGGANVRIAMTVFGEAETVTRVIVDDSGTPQKTITGSSFNDDLTIGVDIAGATETPLKANRGLSHQGFILRGSGFLLGRQEGKALLASDPSLSEVIRPFRNGSDLTRRPDGRFAIDFGTMTEEEARSYEVPYNLLRDRVKPERMAKRERRARELWWQFWRPREEAREALEDLDACILTSEVAKHRIFLFEDPGTVGSNATVIIALEEPWLLGVLSSQVHREWALSTGGTLEDRPRYTKSLCFDPFPFPEVGAPAIDRVSELASRICVHRQKALDRNESVTLTGMYNVVDKLSSGEELTNRKFPL